MKICMSHVDPTIRDDFREKCEQAKLEIVVQRNFLKKQTEPDSSSRLLFPAYLSCSS